VDKKLFGELVESMKQMSEIVQGKRPPSRRFVVNATSVKKLRSKLGLSQPKFAALLHVDAGRFATGSRDAVSLLDRQRRAAIPSTCLRLWPHNAQPDV
jgi:hypothetical protein